ncbi:DNA ligase [Pseudomarimonas salicorniae]|uniref:DNA ligase n=1 Tax=Pseudomarimonas salicorniae TaxID=2933270 RepID=A0ABT0GJE1_9GAMM|nr:DNA ligase [Lysobacter sp. CAU 1642]MCK7594653.1 DNA ligase [Lysobacter sp. CAU 1642]
MHATPAPSSPLSGRWVRAFLMLAALWLAATADAGNAPGLMLASRFQGQPDIAAYWVSEKLDGVRARWDGRRLWTRSGQPIRAPASFTRGWPPMPMDGELWMARGRFARTSGIVRSVEPDAADWSRLRFMLFDLPGHPGPFDDRVRAMRDLVASAAHVHLQMIEQRRLPDRAALDALLRDVVEAGGEGLMLHHGQARYRDGRSDALLKLKPFDDAEGTVVDYTHGRGKYRGLVGALVLRLDNGRLLRVGSGLADADRRTPPPLGSRVTFRYSGHTATGLPRFARYLRVREE